MSTESAGSGGNPSTSGFPSSSAVPGAGETAGPPAPVAPTPPPPVVPPAAPAQEKADKGKGKDHLEAVKHTRTGATWTAIILGTLLLIVLLIFIVQNGEPTKVVFLQWDVSLPLGVLLLAAAIIGVLGTALVGAARMFQVWRAARRSHKA